MRKRNAKLCNIKSGGTYSNHLALNVSSSLLVNIVFHQCAKLGITVF